MKKSFAIACLFLFCDLSSAGQIGLLADGSLPYDTTSASWFITMDARRFDTGNAIEREMLQKFAFGGHIGDDMINRSSENLTLDNSLNSQTNLALSLVKLRKGKKFGLLFSYDIFDGIYLNYRNDLYNLVFKGNTHFGGSTAILGPGIISLSRFQTFSAGLVHQSSGSFISLGIVQSLNHQEIQFDELNVRTNYITVGAFQVPTEVVLDAEEITMRSMEVSFQSALVI